MTELKFRLLDLKQAERFVQTTPNTWWENYDLIIWSPNPSGYTRQNGRFHNGQWGTAKRVVVNRNGLWKIPSVRTNK